MNATVCFSPHPDDAALSLGGWLALQAAEGRPAHVVTVFAGPTPPPETWTAFARELHRSWGGRPDPMAHRRAEDAEALRLLGCTATWWDYRDAIYRHPAYDSRERIFGRPAEEQALEGELVERCAAVPGTLYLFPLAIGHHVDHQLLWRVGMRLAKAGRPCAFYEDLPYAAWEGGPEARVHELPNTWRPQVVDVTAHWGKKVAAVFCYASQFAELSREGQPLLEALESYARLVLPGGYGERIWSP
ncbi:MAG: PIG-L deacetylase family protein [Chloroflexia bacterium]